MFHCSSGESMFLSLLKYSTSYIDLLLKLHIRKHINDYFLLILTFHITRLAYYDRIIKLFLSGFRYYKARYVGLVRFVWKLEIFYKNQKYLHSWPISTAGLFCLLDLVQMNAITTIASRYFKLQTSI